MVLLILALKRLVEALIDDRLVSTFALAFMMVAPLPFGGLKTLHVHEPFLTSRLLANVFVLFGLERALRGRFFIALVLIIVGLAFHPLMAVGGLMIWAACFAWYCFRGSTVLFLATAVGSLPLLSWGLLRWHFLC